MSFVLIAMNCVLAIVVEVRVYQHVQDSEEDYKVKMTKKKRGYYNVELISLREYADRYNVSVTEAYVRVLEQHIKEEPHLWLWSHRRFKHSKR